MRRKVSWGSLAKAGDFAHAPAIVSNDFCSTGLESESVEIEGPANFLSCYLAAEEENGTS